MKNEILEEIWQTRKEIEESDGNDIRKVFERMKRKTAESHRRHYAGIMRKKPPSLEPDATA